MKFVKKLSLFLVLFIAAIALISCGGGNTDGGGNGDGGNTQQPSDDLIIEVSNLEDVYYFNTGDAFSEDILLAGVEIKDQNGKDYKDSIELLGISAIPMNEDGTLKQSGTHTIRLNVLVDGNAVVTEIFKVEVKYVAPITDDIIVNGDFASGTRDPFAIGANEGGTGTLTVVDEELKLTIETVGWTAPFPRIDYVGIALEDGKYYEVQFDARASVARDIHVQLGQLFDAAPWFADCLREQQYFSLTTEMASYSFRFQADATMADLSQVSLLFAHGTLPDGRPSHACDVYYDNIAIVEVDGLGADVSAPTIPTADIALFVGNEINLNLAVTDDQDRNPVVTHNALEVIPNENGVATTAGTYVITVNAKDATGNESTATINVVVNPAVVEGANLLPALGSTDWEVWGESWMTIGGVMEGSAYKLTLAGDAGEAGSNYFQQMKASNLPIEEGKTYTIKVVFTSSITRKVQILVQNDQWWNTHMDEVITLEAGVEYVYEKAFVAVAPAPNVLFGMMFGNIQGSTYPDQHTILISEASLVLGGEVTEDPGQGETPDTPEVPEGNLLPALTDNTKYEYFIWEYKSNPVLDGSAIKVEVPADAVPNNYTYQIKYAGVPVKEGENYTLRLVLSSTIARKVEIMVQNNGEGGNWNLHTDQFIDLEANTPYELEVVFTGIAPTSQVVFCIMLGKIQGNDYNVAHTVTISEASLVLGGEISDEPEDPVDPTQLEMLGESQLLASNEDKWSYWTEYQSTITTSTIIDGVVTIEFNENRGNWYGIQLFREDSAIAAGKYNLNIEIDSTVACQITIFGNVVNLVVGENTISVPVTVVDSNASFNLQFGVNGKSTVLEGKFVLSNLTYTTPEEPETPDTPVVPGDTQPIALDATRTKVEGAGIHIYLADKPNLTIDDFTITVISFESTQFAGYKDQIMGATAKVHYIVGDGWLFSTIPAGFPNEGDQVMVVNVSYVLNGVTYSQNVKFVSNAYVAE